MISYVIPTRDRPDELARTLDAVAALDHRGVPAEVVVADNASRLPPALPARLANGVPVRSLRFERNLAAAARNHAARRDEHPWLLMLDDDSAPLDTRFLDALRDAPPDAAAIAGSIRLPDGRREAGGLPEVFVGCGALVRRDAFLDAGGYDESFHYYAEEYDLCARFILAGLRVLHDHRLRVEHRKVHAGRDMNTILARLVRNNGWVDLRYAPDHRRADAVARTMRRYERIARKERALRGYREGVRELLATADHQPRTPMTRAQDDRFTGLAAARDHLARALPACNASRVALAEEGKHAWAVRAALDELPARVVDARDEPDALVVATLSPGPMLDARDRLLDTTPRPVVTPWAPPHDDAPAHAHADARPDADADPRRTPHAA